MGYLAGVFYFDRRPIGRSPIHTICNAFDPAYLDGIQTLTSPGLVMAHCGHFADSAEYATDTLHTDVSKCVWDGRLDNADEISSSPGLTAEATSRARLVLALHEKRGIEGFRRLIGDWSLVLWDAVKQEVVLASDYAGIRPLYFFHGRDELLWSSSLHRLTSWARLSDLDEAYIASYLARGTGGGRTPYRGIQIVPPGHAVRICRNGMRLQRFWDPPLNQELLLRRESDYAERLRTLFEEAVRVRLQTREPVCAELSGGLDSSSIASMAQSLIARRLVPSARLVAFRYQQVASSDEKFSQIVADAFGIECTSLNTTQFPFVSSDATGHGAPLWWEPRLREVVRRMESLTSDVMLTGQLGDLVMGNWYDGSEQVAASLREWNLVAACQQASCWAQARSSSVYSVLWNAISSLANPSSEPVSLTPSSPGPLGNSLTPLCRELTNDLNRGRKQRSNWADVHPARRDRLRALSEMLEARCLQCPEPLQAFSYTHPFGHRPLVEFMLSIPSRLVYGPAAPRRLMRLAFSDLLPRQVLHRRSKASFNSTFRAGLRPLASTLLRTPSEIRLVDAGYVEPVSLKRRLERFVGGLDCGEGQLRAILLLEFWMRNRERRLQPWYNSASV